MRILVVDDHAIVRRGLKQILTEDFNSVELGEAKDARSAIDLISKERWDAVVLDINLPGKNGLDVLREVRKVRPNLPVLVLSMYPEDQYAVRVIKAGAAGYLTKESAPNELVKALKKIMSGKKYVTPSVGEKLAMELEGRTKMSPHETLADREYQVMMMIASGKTLATIARELFLSPKTVSCYRARVLAKMSMENNLELISYAVKKKLVE